eukprot:TRINITY_DN775909_c0_g1_i1.p1 TRINITY_DN775909_c0_g1~~TRINITY_DN775909_c0_g1_i1.p1  ORF type:complete len:247 (+),score=57.38 TRINITY_DN775909_c0_g1_i1:98-838(+)
MKFNHKIIYLLTTALILTGAFLIYHCQKTTKEDEYLPEDVTLAGTVFGAVLVVVGLCGMYGTCKNKRRKEEHRCNTILTFYFIGMFALLAISGFLLFETVQYQKVISNSDDLNNGDVQKLDQDITKAIQKNSKIWRDTQDSFECCGWQWENPAAMAGPTTFPTSDKYCLGGKPLEGLEPCRTSILGKLKDHIHIVMLIESILTLILFIGNLSALWMMCCQHYKKNDRYEKSLLAHRTRGDAYLYQA